MEITINPEYERLIRPLTNKEYQDLFSDIKRDNKIFIPIITNKDGVLLDGHHRLKIAQKLGITDIPIKQVDFPDKLEEKLFVIRCNKNRRHLDLADRAFLANEESKIYAEIAKKKQIEAGRFGKLGGRPKKDAKPLASQDAPPKAKPKKKRSAESNRKRRESKSKHKAGKSQGLSPETLERYQYLEKHSPELFKKVNDKSIAIGKAYRILKAQEKRQEREQKASEIQLDTESSGMIPFMIAPRDFRTGFDEFAPDSVDLIFTDPPYSQEHLPLYAELSKFAAKVLKPGGSLVTFVGEYALPEIFQLILSNSDSKLKYWWRIIVKHAGKRARVHDRRVIVFAKLLIWFVKGERPTMISDMDDYVESEPPDKDLHEWAQSPVEAEHVINHLTVKGELVVDPFMGSGSTGVAALKLDRKFIGYEKDVSRHLIAGQRLTQFLNDREMI